MGGRFRANHGNGLERPMAIDVQCQCEVVQPRAFGEDLGFPHPPPPACVSRRAAQSLNLFQIHDSSKYWQATIGLSRASQTDRVTALGLATRQPPE